MKHWLKSQEAEDQAQLVADSRGEARERYLVEWVTRMVREELNKKRTSWTAIPHTTVGLDS